MALPSGWEIPLAIRSRFGEKLGRQRAMAAEGHLVLVLHRCPAGTDTTRHAVAYWRDPEGRWSCSTGGEGRAKLVAHIGEYERREDELEAAYDSASSADGWHAVLQDAVPLHRAAANLQTTFQTAREAVPHDRDLITLRDRAIDIEREIELLHVDVKHALEYAAARQGEEQSRLAYELGRSGHRLAVLAAIFLPVTAITSIFGMNLRSGLEPHGPIVFWSVFVLGLILGAVIYQSIAGPQVKENNTRHGSPQKRDAGKLGVRKPPA